ELGLSSCQVTSAGVFLPSTIEFQVSLDGIIFKPVATITNKVPGKKPIEDLVLSTAIKEVKARHVRVHAKSLGIIPDWHKARGRKAWLFVDEILVNPKP
ncbi:discoidin domain-containing protein, partial [Akkermansiaceae bacterium]|nr:discoidin domain-containing protein [Akkermansiaceae bacterium]